MKRKLSILIIFLIFIFLLSCPQDAYVYAKSGILLWYNKILPTLLPFTILMNVILPLGLLHPLCLRLEKLLKGILPISAYGWYVFFAGFLFGFPMGAKVSADLVADKKLSKAEGNILASTCNQFGPMFISSFVMIQCLNCEALILPGFVILYGSSLVLLLFQYIFFKNEAPPDRYFIKSETPRSQMSFKILDAAIMNGFETMIKLCGYIMMFSMLAGIINHLPQFYGYFNEIATGLLEVTNGVEVIAASELSFHHKFVITLAVTAFGGCSGLAQTASFFKETGLSIVYYCGIKLANASLAALLAIFFLRFLN